ncbi:MAG: hypothetical protein IJ833_04285 [Lachnospiraceae bacterium]|nr:hypothetical protein [Lachnospiraceae bacterium]
MRKMRVLGRSFLLLLVVFVLSGCSTGEPAESAVVSMLKSTLSEAMSESDTGDCPVEDEQEDLFLMTKVHPFAYDSLRLIEQEWYREIEQSLGNMEENTRLDVSLLAEGLSIEDIDFIFQCVMMDHPELFYVEGYTYTKYTRGEEIVAIEFNGTWNAKREEVLSKMAEIESAVMPLLEGAKDCTSDYERIKYVYETIIRNTEYGMDSPDNQNIYSVFVDHVSVCQGYAKAAQFLLNRMGIECTLVQGKVDTGEKHAWNLVKSDGSYYYMDCTWGDASYQTEDVLEDVGGKPEINYDYLCVNTELLCQTHTVDSVVSLPYCVDDRDNYYVREGALFSEYDREKMRHLFEHAMESGKQHISLRCTDTACFDSILRAMVEKQEVFDYIQDTEVKVAYSHNDQQLSMTFWVTND